MPVFYTPFEISNTTVLTVLFLTEPLPYINPPPVMANGTMSEQEEEVKEYNIFRDSLLRYLGYTNEVGGEFNKRGNRPKFRLCCSSLLKPLLRVCGE
jgi:hypothetical protein